jgi:EmrB/QacA subfamily drug resistance transporter
MDFTNSNQSKKLNTCVLLTTSLVSSLIMLDSNIVAVSLPAIGKSLAASFADLQWVVSAYLLGYSSLLLAMGALADLIGRKKIMILGLIVFAVASAVCGFSTGLLPLNIARAVQGVGGAMLLTSSLAIITHTFKGAERAHAFAIWGAYLGIALTAGPIVGGVITKLFGWRWIFLVNLPVCLILIVASLALIRESCDPESKALDFPGIFTLCPALFLLVWALIDGNDLGWKTNSILLRMAGSFILLLLFVVVELKQKRPMVDFSLFKRRTFLGAVYAMVGYGAAAQVMIFYLPLFLENAYGFASAKAGLAMIPFAIPMVLVPRIMGRFTSQYSGRAVLTFGLGVSVLGNILFWFSASNGYPYTFFVFAMLVAGIGAGILNGETVKVLGSAIPPERAGMASGLASTTRFIGVLLGVAGFGALLSGVAHGAFVKFASSVGLEPATAELAAHHVTSGNVAELLKLVPASVQSSIQAAGLSAFAKGFGSASLLAAAIAAISGLLAFRFISETETSPAKSMGPSEPAAAID